MISVICWLWSDPNFRFKSTFRYTVEHVVRLQQMVERNLSMPHDFVCLTDRPQEDFPSTVRCMPLWDELADLGGCYRRLPVFGRVGGALLGQRFVSIDLDCVITESLDPLFDRAEPFLIWEDVDPRQPYCGSMFMMDVGAVSYVWDSFLVDQFMKAGHYREEARKKFIGTDQSWLAHILDPNDVTLWNKSDGVYSISDRQFRPRLRPGKVGTLEAMAQAGVRTELPERCRIVFFHGKRDPSMALVQEVHPWITEHYGEPFETVE